MNQPNWREFALEEGMLREAISDGGRIVLWLPTDRDGSFQYWERVANVTRGEIAIDHGLCTTGGHFDSSQADVCAASRASSGTGCSDPSENGTSCFPTVPPAEQCGERQNDLILVWSQEQGGILDEGRIQSRWPKAERIRKLGHNLFLVAGVTSRRTRNRAWRRRHHRAARAPARMPRRSWPPRGGQAPARKKPPRSPTWA